MHLDVHQQINRYENGVCISMCVRVYMYIYTRTHIHMNTVEFCSAVKEKCNQCICKKIDEARNFLNASILIIDL